MGQGRLEGEDGEAFSPVNSEFPVRFNEHLDTVLAGVGPTRQVISCSPTLPEPELTPPRYPDPELGATKSPADPESAEDPWRQDDPWSRRPGAEGSASSTESKKHGTEELRAQTDNNSSVAVQAPCNTMTPAAPVMQISAEASAIVAAIDGALAPRWDPGTDGNASGANDELENRGCSIGSTGSTIMTKRMSEVERQLRDITAGRCFGSAAASSAASSEPHPEPARGSRAHHPPKHQRTVLVVGGFPFDTERDVICEKMRKIFGQDQLSESGGHREKSDQWERSTCTRMIMLGRF